MRVLIALALAFMSNFAFGADGGGETHRYVIERTFPAGALDGVDAAAKQKVNANNASLGVNWVKSYANADKTKTYCVYEGPDESAIRKAAALNGLPVDRVTEVPVQVEGSSPAPSPAHRFVVQMTGKAGTPGAESGVRFVTSYSNAQKTASYSIYEGPSESDVRKAISASGATVSSIAEVPVTLLPR